MVRDTFNKCQVHCYPGSAEERLKDERESQKLVDEKKAQEMAERELMEEMKKEFPEMASSLPITAPSSAGSHSSKTPQQQTRLADTNPNPVRNTTTYEGIQTAMLLHHQKRSITHTVKVRSFFVYRWKHKSRANPLLKPSWPFSLLNRMGDPRTSRS